MSEPGYALAMRVLQSDLYAKLDDEEKADCDSLIHRAPSPVGTAPLREALEAVSRWRGVGMDSIEHFEDIGKMFYADTGFLRPGKSEPMETHSEDREKRKYEVWSVWCERKNREINDQIALALLPRSAPEREGM